MLFYCCLVAAGLVIFLYAAAFFLLKKIFGRGSSFFSYANKTPHKATAAEPSETEEHSVCGRRGTLLKADLSLASQAAHSNGQNTTAAEPRPLVVIVPGYGDGLVAAAGPAAAWMKNGHDVLTIHPRATGRSGGRYCGTPSLDGEDLICWLKYIERKFPGRKIILHGFSLGAAAILVAVSSRKFSRLDISGRTLAVIADSACTSLSEAFSCYFRHFAGTSRFQKALFLLLSHFLSSVCFLTGRGHFRTFSPMRALKGRHFRKHGIPVLFIHGGSDVMFGKEMARKLCDEAEKSVRSGLLVAEGAAHAAAFHEDPERYMESVLTFMNLR